MSDKETSITIDHDTGTVLVDTNVRSIATMLKVRGFVEFGDERSAPFRRFSGIEKQVAFRKLTKSASRVERGKKLAQKRKSDGGK